MPKAHSLWLVDADLSNFAAALKGIRTALHKLGYEPASLRSAKEFFDLYRGGGPVLLGAHDDAEVVAEAGRVLEEASSGAATPAIDPDPNDLEAVRVHGVAEGLWAPREGEEGLTEPQEGSDDDVTGFEQRLYDTSLLLMAQTDGNPIAAYIFALQLHEATREEIFELVADAIKTTFGFSLKDADNG